MGKTRTRKITSAFFIGLFVISGTLIAIGAVIWLGASRFFEERNIYVTYFDGSVEGLESGSSVKYLGVEVGNVSKIGVAPDGKLIEVLFQMDKKIGVTEKLRVKLEIIGISGRKFLQLHFPGEQMAKLNPQLSFEPEYKYIKSSPSGLEEIEIAMREVMHNFKKLDIESISRETVGFLSSTTDFFSNPDIYKTIENLRNSSFHLQSLAARADTALIIEYLSQSGSNMLQTTNELKAFVEELNKQMSEMKLDMHIAKAFAGYDSTLWEMRNIMHSIGYRTETAIINFNEAMYKLNETNTQLKRALSIITESPSTIFLSEPPPPEK